MQKWLNDLYAIILKQGFDPEGGGSGPTPEPTPEPEPYSNIYLGKYLGDTYTDEQKQAIANGTFEGLNIGDYWTINGINWRIADADYYLNVGDTPFTKHHVVVIPDTTLYNAQMNSTGTNSDCYTGSQMYTTNLNNARTAFDDAFGSSYIPVHRGSYSYSSTGYEFRNMRIELMSEEQVYGHAVWGLGSANGFDVGTQKTQFRLFSINKTKINIRENYWLTNILSPRFFAYVSANGEAKYGEATSSIGVRPFACIIGDPD